ncbi:hypothetical protein LLH23_19550 [bacterium]|nr:hypothetical protein [bacterium]
MPARLALALAALCGATLALAQTNPVSNPGFETLAPATNLPQDWEPVYWSNPRGKIEASDDAHSGARSLQITGLPREQITDAGKANNNIAGQELGDRLVGPGRMTLRVWLRTSGDGMAYCSVMTADEKGNRLQYLSSRRIEQQPEWTELVWDFSTDAATRSVLLYLRNGGAGSVWYDDVQLIPAGDVLDNDFARAIVEPILGGRVCSYVLKPGDHETTVWQGIRPGGMAAEIAPAEAPPGLLRDDPCILEVIEPRRCVRVRHQGAGGSLADLQFEKELRLPDGSASLEVTLRVRNTAAEKRCLSLRVQQALPPGHGVFTWPARDHLRVVQPLESLTRANIPITDLREGWLAYSDPAAQRSLAVLFDRAQTEHALVSLTPALNTLEWTYRPVELPAGGTWQTTYLIAPVPGGGPIVSASRDLAVSLSPLNLPGAGDLTLGVAPVSGARSAEVRVTGRVAGKPVSWQQTVPLSPTTPAALKLPWPGQQVQELRLVAGTGPTAQSVALSPALINARFPQNLPAPPDDNPYPALAGFYPFGEYFRGYTGPEMGTLQQATERQLRLYRRAYLNTYIVGENICLTPLKAGEKPWLCDLARQYHMRLIPKGDMLRRFGHRPDGAYVELPEPPGTREAMLARIAETGFDLDLRRTFAREYGDLILAYDLSDEPGSGHVPAYVELQSLYREADPNHPVLVILNLDRTEYLPYMPVYYGDEYPIRNTGRRPWEVTKLVRFCARQTPAPVWVMLPAFGGREGYTWLLPTGPETRLMIWLVVANGGKGITWHGSQSPPCWRYNQHYFYTLCDSWGVGTSGWEALRAAGRQVTAIGPSLLETDCVDDHPFTAEAQPLDLGKAAYQGPAVTLGVLKQRTGGGFFIVAVNQDVEHEQQATLRADAGKLGAATQLCDLSGLTAPAPFPAGGLAVTLAPGDGRVLYCGTAAGAQAALAAVHRGHYDNERVIYDMDAAVAAANGVDLGAAAGLSRQAAEATKRGDYTLAHARLSAAQAKLAEAVTAAKPLGEVLAQLQDSLRLLSEVADVYRANFDVLVPPDLVKQSPRSQPFANTRDAKLQQLVDDTAEAFCQRLLLEDRVVAGEAAAVAAPAAELLAQAQRLHAEAIPYVRSRAGATP